MARKFTCSSYGPIVETKYGKLRGFEADGVFAFHGIKYADAGRFQMPEEPESWEGIRNALAYGYVCPMLTQDMPNMEVMVPHRYWPMDENCQYLNIWTTSLNRNEKKPVMVWLHGGGFAAGSSIEQIAYEGDHLCEYGDVVVVTLNHRLNILGYLDLSAFDEKYENSANVGNADMTAALRWIHENIEAFGGDPENVTLFGQSGGGMKVFCLMQTPEADGLFQKGIIQSGVLDHFMPEKYDDTSAIGRALLKELQIPEDQVQRLEEIPYPVLAEAYRKVVPDLARRGEYVGGAPLPNSYYLGDPRKVGFTEHAKTIPLMIGTVFGEFDFQPGIPDKRKLSEERIKTLLKEKFGESAGALAAEFCVAYPDKCLTDLLSLDSKFRIPTKDFITKRAACPEAPVYSYLFAWEFPLDEGKPAWHCSEIPFVFHNTDRVPVCCVPGVSDRLEEQISGAWIHFARYGSPQIPSLPEWPACRPGDEATMIFDRKCRVAHEYDNRLMELLVQAQMIEEERKGEHGEGFFLH